MIAKKKLKNMKNYGVKSDIYLRQWLKTQIIMMKNIWKSNLNDELPLNKMIEIPSMIIVVRAVFHKSNSYYPQDFSNKFLYKL